MVDDHDGARRAMCLVLEREKGVAVCGQAASGTEAVDRALRLRPDIVVMDVAMPRMNGLQAAEQIGRALPDTQVLLVSLSASELRIGSRGAIRGLVNKQNAAAELPEAVHALLRGDTYFRQPPENRELSN